MQFFMTSLGEELKTVRSQHMMQLWNCEKKLEYCLLKFLLSKLWAMTRQFLTHEHVGHQMEAYLTRWIKLQPRPSNGRVSLPVGKELANEINQALEIYGVDLRALALVDDTIADLVGGRYYNNESIATITLGMITNAAYIEPPQEVPKWHGPSPESGEMVISIEWGNFKSQL